MDKFLEDIEGIGTDALGARKPAPFTDQADQIEQFVRGYDGTFGFLQSLKRQLLNRGELSAAQWDAARKCYFQDQKFKSAAERRVIKPQIEPGALFRTNRFIARQVGLKTGLNRPHFVFEVVEPLHETEKAYLLKVRASAKRTSYCGLCGLELTDPRSVLAGIGPVCADNNGLPWGEDALGALNEQLTETKVVEAWFPKQSLEFFK